jgi:hypothetical protein
MLNVNELMGLGITKPKATDVTYITNAFANGTNLVMPALANVDDIAIYSSSSASSSTAPSVDVPSGWSDLYNYSTANVKYRILFKILNTNDLNSTIINTTNASVVIYRPNGFVNPITLSSGGQDSTSNPSNQTIPSSTYNGSLLLEMMLYRHNDPAFGMTRGSTYSDFEINNTTNANYLKFKKYRPEDTALNNTISFSSSAARRFLGNILIGVV